MIGLFGQQAAYARSVRSIVTATSASQMDAGCMAMMEKPSQPAQQPCKGLTLDCIAAMGCVLPIALREPAASVATPRIFPMEAYWPSTSILAGGDIAPEPEPPTTLG